MQKEVFKAVIYVANAFVLMGRYAKLLKERSCIMKKQTGVDPANIDYVVLEVRFKKPTAALNFSLPEYLAVASGDFSADAILLLVRQASGGKLRDEKYGAKTYSLLTIDPLAKEAEK